MAVTAGTNTIKLRNIASISISSASAPENDNFHEGDNILDGVEVKLEKGESIRVASGKDRALSEKVTMSFEIVEGLEDEFEKLLWCNNKKVTITLSTTVPTSISVIGFLSVNRAVAKMISYKCMMEVTAEDADAIIDWSV